MTYDAIIAEIQDAIESGASLMLEDLTGEAQAILRAHTAQTGEELPLPSREEM